ncbi:MAG TPA: DUF4954 family protein, partial [Pirellulaceae bacterium]|nr:DUF4954 family protein [Pirellulaceae bacterium]
YDRAVRRYLSEQIVRRLEQMVAVGQAFETLKADEQGIADLGDWSDVGGCYLAHSRLKQLLSALAEGRISDTRSLQAELAQASRRIDSDEWNWAWRTWLAENGRREATVTVDDLQKAIDQWRIEATYLTRAVLDDGQEDLAVAEMWDADRRALSRLRLETPAAADRLNSLVCSLENELAEIQDRAARLAAWLAGDGPVESEVAA